MTEDQKRVRETLEFWRLERDRLLIEIGGYQTGQLRLQRDTRDGWVDISREQLHALRARLGHVTELFTFFEGALEH